MLDNLGDIALNQGDYEETRQLYTESLQIQRDIGDKQGIAESIHQFGKLAQAEGDSAQAALLLLHATRLYEDMQAASGKDAVEVQEALAGIQKEIGTEQFEIIKQRTETMSAEQVIELILA